MINLDRIDINILSTLQSEGRITQYRLSEIVGLSPSACHQRLKKLEETKLVRGYYAEVDIDRLVSTITMIVTVELKNNESKSRSEFEKFIRNCDVILECYGTSGEFDYILKAVSNNILDYQVLLDQIVDESVGTVKYKTYFVTKLVKRYRGMPIRHLLDFSATEAEGIQMTNNISNKKL